MAHLSLSQFLVLLAVAAIVLLWMRQRDGYWPQLLRELRTMFHVFSGETTAGKETELARDPRPKRWRYRFWTIMTAAVLLLALAISWITASSRA